jgi:hypothetical protein
VWATTQDEPNKPFARSEVRSLRPEVASLLGARGSRCPRCHGTLWLEMTEPEEYETDLLIGA